MLHAASRLQALDLFWREQPGVVVLNSSDRFLVLNAVNQENVVWDVRLSDTDSGQMVTNDENLLALRILRDIAAGVGRIAMHNGLSRIRTLEDRPRSQDESRRSSFPVTLWKMPCERPSIHRACPVHFSFTPTPQAPWEEPWLSTH